MIIFIFCIMLLLITSSHRLWPFFGYIIIGYRAHSKVSETTTNTVHLKEVIPISL